MSYTARLQKFQAHLADVADVAFIPLSADLQYLTGVPRDVPSYGRVMHPGAWLEGAWISPLHTPVLPLPRMTVEFGGLNALDGVDVRVLGDWDDPAMLVSEILRGFGLPPKPKIAISDSTTGETVAVLHRLMPDAQFLSATDVLRPMRMIKSEDEIALMRRAGEITEAAFADVLAQLKIGMTELDIISEINHQLRRHGGLGDSFPTALYNSGPNHPLLFGDRLNTWQRVLTPPVSVLFDFGAIYEGYCYDFGRTVSFGEPSAAQIEVHRLVMASQAAGVAVMKSNEVIAEEVDAAARQVIDEGGYGAEFRHRLGHGIGLDVHEPPFLTRTDTTTLQAGMLFTVEPSITQFNGVSARVEDVVLVTPDGGKPLTTGYQDLIVIS